MWSLGCVMAELFLGWPLYPGALEYDQVTPPRRPEAPVSLSHAPLCFLSLLSEREEMNQGMGSSSS